MSIDVKEMLYSEYLHWEDISHLGSEERVATVLDEGFFEWVKYPNSEREVKRLILTLQLKHDKTIIKFKCNKRTMRNMVAKFGTRVSDWRGAVVKLDPYIYQGDKETIELKPTSKVAVSLDKKLSGPHDAAMSEILKLMDSFKNRENKGI